MKKRTASQNAKSFPAMRADSKHSPLPPPPPLPAGLAKLITKAEGQKRLDSWQNVLTGAGVAGKDRRLAGTSKWDGLMLEPVAEQIYAGDKLARRIVEIIPHECLKNWIKFDGMEELTAPIEEELDRLQAQHKFTEAANWARLYGGSALFMATGEDPEDFQEPLDPKNFDSVKSLVLFSRWELLVRSTDLETDINDPNYGEPKFYWLTPRKGNVSKLFSVKIHHSRLIRFMGEPLPLRLKVFNRYWGDSVYTGVIEALRDYGLSIGSIASVMQEFRQVVYKIKELTDGLSTVDSAAIQQRLATINAVKSVFGTYFLDMDEEMEIHSDTFAGVADMLQALKERLQSSTDIPHTILFGESAGGAGGGSSLGQSGQTGLESWYNHLEAKQKNYFKPKVNQLLAAVMQAPKGPTKGQEPEGWKWEFNKMQTMDETQATALESSQYDADSKAQGLGIDSPIDTLKKRRPEKYKEMVEKHGGSEAEFQASVQQLLQAEMEKAMDPNAAQGAEGLAQGEGVVKPTDQKPLVQERDKVVVKPNPKGKQ
jgi:phage-related protein (TIGR01555 family)